RAQPPSPAASPQAQGAYRSGPQSQQFRTSRISSTYSHQHNPDNVDLKKYQFGSQGNIQARPNGGQIPLVAPIRRKRRSLKDRTILPFPIRLPNRQLLPSYPNLPDC